MMVKQKRETGRSIGKQIKHKGIAQNRNVTWIENTESTKESEIGFGPEMEDGGGREEWEGEWRSSVVGVSEKEGERDVIYPKALQPFYFINNPLGRIQRGH